jgi:hypothetical protein
VPLSAALAVTVRIPEMNIIAKNNDINLFIILPPVFSIIN